MNRGDVFWVNLDPTVGSEIRKKRPCVLIGANALNKARRTVVIIPLSSSPHPHPPVTVEISFLDKQVVAVIDQIRAVDKSRFMEKAGKITDKELKAIEAGMRQVLSLP